MERVTGRLNAGTEVLEVEEVEEGKSWRRTVSVGCRDKSDLVSGLEKGVGGRNFNLGNLNQREGLGGLEVGVGGVEDALGEEAPEEEGRKDRKRSCKETELGVEGEDAEGVE